MTTNESPYFVLWLISLDECQLIFAMNIYLRLENKGKRVSGVPFDMSHENFKVFWKERLGTREKPLF